MDNEFGIDLADVERNIDSAEVLSIYFPLLARTLIVDMRTTSTSGPLIKLMPMVRSMNERFRVLRRLRPEFGKPENITVIPWPKYVDSMVRLGIWDKLMARLADGGYLDSIGEARAAMEEMRETEHAVVQGALKGRGFQTLWPATKR